MTLVSVLAAEWRRLADELGAASKRGDADAMMRLTEEMNTLTGDMLRQLRGGERSANIPPVNNDAQIAARRGRAIASAKLDPTDSRRAALVHRWGSQAKAAKALGISGASLVAYLDGVTPCPRRVAERALRQAGIPLAAWSSVVD